MKLIEEAGKSWRWFSMQAMAVSTATLTTWGALPEKYQALVPIQYVLYGVAAVLVLGIIGRLVDQTKPSPADDVSTDPKP